MGRSEPALQRKLFDCLGFWIETAMMWDLSGKIRLPAARSLVTPQA